MVVPTDARRGEPLRPVAPGCDHRLESMGEELHRVSRNTVERICRGGRRRRHGHLHPEARRGRARPYFVYAGSISEWQGHGHVRRGPRAHPAASHPEAVLPRARTGLGLRAVAGRGAPRPGRRRPRVQPRPRAAFLRGAVAALASVVPRCGLHRQPKKLLRRRRVPRPYRLRGRGRDSRHGRRAVGTPVDFAPGGGGRQLEDTLEASTTKPDVRGTRGPVAGCEHASLAASGALPRRGCWRLRSSARWPPAAQVPRHRRGQVDRPRTTPLARRRPRGITIRAARATPVAADRAASGIFRRDNCPHD
ncbi:hypothetical protein QJS66_22810 [Kocuria rhizophila]|nr:hypothetical protein QJS66_22810 [Kocuria rhizophila]